MEIFSVNIGEEILQLTMAVVYGGIIGFEREYRSKAAGFRTITMITLGATLFTVLSFQIGTEGSHDRIAANVVMGIGFLGAGVIFKDGFSVSGLTTSATIWVSAAMGMALGIKEYIVATATLVLAIVVLSLFEKIQDLIDKYHQARVYRISYHADFKNHQQAVEGELNKLPLKYKIKKSWRSQDEVSFQYLITGKNVELDKFTTYLMNSRDVRSFEE